MGLVVAFLLVILINACAASLIGVYEPEPSVDTSRRAASPEGVELSRGDAFVQ